MPPLIITYLALLSAATLSYIWSYPKGDFYVRLLLWYLVLSLLVSFASLYLVKHNNLFLFHIFTPLEYTLLSLVYYKYIDNRLIKKMILVSIPVFLLLAAFLSLYIQKVQENNSYQYYLESIALIGWSLFALRQLLSVQQKTPLQLFPMFWISIGILYYFIGNLFTEGLLNYAMHRSISLARQIYYISFIFKYLFFVLLIIANHCRQLFNHRS